MSNTYLIRSTDSRGGEQRHTLVDTAMASLPLVSLILLAVTSRAQEASNITEIVYPGNGTDTQSTRVNETTTTVPDVPAENTTMATGVKLDLDVPSVATPQPNQTVQPVESVVVRRGVGDDCVEDIECNRTVLNSACINSKCECITNYVHDQGVCWEKQILGGSCNNILQCQDIAYTKCFQGVCACEASRIPSTINSCLEPASEYLSACEEDIQCTYSFGDEARCSNSQCKCTSNFHYNGTFCTEDKKLGDACSIDEECVTSELGYVEGSRVCTNSICDCATGHSALPGEEICTKSSGEELTVSLTWVLCVIVAKYYLQ